MTFLAAIFREIFGLFVDDEGLALAILGVLAVAILFAFAFQAATIAGAVLLLGCLGAIVFSTLKARPRG